MCHKYYDVIGAGKIRISDTPRFLCGYEQGFHFGVEWSNHSWIGGLLSKSEAKKLAEDILDALKDYKEDDR